MMSFFHWSPFPYIDTEQCLVLAYSGCPGKVAINRLLLWLLSGPASIDAC